MDTIEAIKTRRSIKHYDENFEIPAEDEAILKDLLRQSPTSFNLQNWRFVIVKDKDLRAEIQEAAWGQEQVSKASLLFLCCADLKAWDKDPARYWEKAPQEAQDILVPMIKPFYEGKEWQQRDEAMRSIGIASQSLMVGAKALGYGSCPMIGFDADKVAELINLPEDHVVGMMVTVGKGVKPAWDKPGYISDDEAFIENKF